MKFILNFEFEYNEDKYIVTCACPGNRIARGESSYDIILAFNKCLIDMKEQITILNYYA